MLFISKKLSLVLLIWFVMVISFVWSTKSKEHTFTLLNYVRVKIFQIKFLCFLNLFIYLFSSEQLVTFTVTSIKLLWPRNTSRLQATEPWVNLWHKSVFPVFQFYQVENMFLFVLRMERGTLMICGRWKCAAVGKATGWKCCVAKFAFCTKPRAACCTLLERLFPSGGASSSSLWFLFCV